MFWCAAKNFWTLYGETFLVMGLVEMVDPLTALNDSLFGVLCSYCLLQISKADLVMAAGAMLSVIPQTHKPAEEHRDTATCGPAALHTDTAVCVWRWALLLQQNLLFSLGGLKHDDHAVHVQAPKNAVSPSSLKEKTVNITTDILDSSYLENN